jgi:hypothetical protein
MPPINAIAIAIFDSVTVSIGDDIYSSDMSPLRQRKLSRYGRLQQKKKREGWARERRRGHQCYLQMVSLFECWMSIVTQVLLHQL